MAFTEPRGIGLPLPSLPNEGGVHCYTLSPTPRCQMLDDGLVPMLLRLHHLLPSCQRISIPRFRYMAALRPHLT